MKKINIYYFLLFVTSLSIITGCSNGGNILRLSPYKNYLLDGNRSSVIQQYIMRSTAVTHQMDESHSSFTLKLKIIATPLSTPGQIQYKCLSLTYQVNDLNEIEIPSFKNWEYILSEIGTDDNNQVFGIDHTKFEKLIDANGNEIEFSQKYSIYNSFIDFHSFVDLLSQPIKGGNGIQNLKFVGDTIIHAAAFTKAPTHLGDSIKVGSYFKNGQVKMSLNGLSITNKRHSAIIAYDSGKSSFKMIMQMSPDFEMETVGNSNYFGYIFKDLDDNWVNKVVMKEFVFSNTEIPPPISKQIIASIEREIIIDRK